MDTRRQHLRHAQLPQEGHHEQALLRLRQARHLALEKFPVLPVATRQHSVFAQVRKITEWLTGTRAPVWRASVVCFALAKVLGRSAFRRCKTAKNIHLFD